MYKNLFKQKPKDSVKTLDVNIYSNRQFCKFTETEEGLSRVYSDTSVLDWETFVYFYLDDKMPGVTPEMTIKENYVIYKIKNIVSLKEYISKNLRMYSCILNELVAFVKTFKKIGFVHGNLHISNIYVDSSGKIYKFYIIDFANSYIKDFEALGYKRNSYGDKVIPLGYCDMTTLYHSITHHLAIMNTNKTIFDYTTRLFSDSIVF